MAIALEFIDFVVPITATREKYPGGWDACLRDHEGLIGRRVWFDDHLFRDGAMNTGDVREIARRWKALGFDLNEMKRGVMHWKDVCVIESIFGGPTLPCEWIEGRVPGGGVARRFGAARERAP